MKDKSLYGPVAARTQLATPGIAAPAGWPEAVNLARCVVDGPSAVTPKGLAQLATAVLAADAIICTQPATPDVVDRALAAERQVDALMDTAKEWALLCVLQRPVPQRNQARDVFKAALEKALATPPDDYKAWYEDAMAASNEAGFVGLSAAETIRALSATPAQQGEPLTDAVSMTALRTHLFETAICPVCQSNVQQGEPPAVPSIQNFADRVRAKGIKAYAIATPPAQPAPVPAAELSLTDEQIRGFARDQWWMDSQATYTPEIEFARTILAAAQKGTP